MKNKTRTGPIEIRFSGGQRSHVSMGLQRVGDDLVTEQQQTVNRNNVALLIYIKSVYINNNIYIIKYNCFY